MLLVLFYGAAGQQPNIDKVFEPVPPEHRAQLEQRLKLLVEYQQKQDWAHEYDLFSALRRRAEGKADFIALSRKEIIHGWKLPLVGFVPVRVGEFRPDSKTFVWMITGCARLKKGQQIVIETAGVEAYWERNNWFFSEVQMIGDLHAEPCGQILNE